MQAEYNGVKISESDIVNPEEFIGRGEYNPHNVHGWILHDHGFVVAVVFASNLQDALDIAVDADKMDRYLISSESERADYSADGEELSYLGNAGEPFDIESLQVIELPHFPRSIVAQFAASLPAASDSAAR